MQSQPDVFKVSFVGDASVGKTSIIARYSNRHFLESPATTVGTSVVQVILPYGDNQFIVNLWDTAGQERFRSLVPLYIRGADLVVLVFAVSNAESFRGLEPWLHEIRDNTTVSCPIIIVGNKSDLDWTISKEEAQNWALSQQCQIVFTSAKSEENITALFQIIAEFRANTNKGEMNRISPMPASAQPESECC
jgi:small GTP-binding protein